MGPTCGKGQDVVVMWMFFNGKPNRWCLAKFTHCAASGTHMNECSLKRPLGRCTRMKANPTAYPSNQPQVPQRKEHQLVFALTLLSQKIKGYISYVFFHFVYFCDNYFHFLYPGKLSSRWDNTSPYKLSIFFVENLYYQG